MRRKFGLDQALILTLLRRRLLIKLPVLQIKAALRYTLRVSCAEARKGSSNVFLPKRIIDAQARLFFVTPMLCRRIRLR